MIRPLLSRPSAWIPIVISLAAAGLVWWHVARVGVERQADEGAEARLFQLLLLLEVPVVLYFAARWLPVRTKEAVVTLALQAFAVFFALASVYWFESLAPAV